MVLDSDDDFLTVSEILFPNTLPTKDYEKMHDSVVQIIVDFVRTGWLILFPSKYAHILNVFHIEIQHH